jgi:hypothetical protein
MHRQGNALLRDFYRVLEIAEEGATMAKLTLKVNCGCGFIATEEASSTDRNPTTNVRKMLVEALNHAIETGHGLELHGLIKKEQV